MIQMIPLLMLSLIFTNPNHYIIKVLSYIPFTAPQVMLMRMSITHVELWEVLASIGVMFVFSVLSFVLSVKLFKIGVLIYDESIDLKKIIKIIRSK
jgi:ABC-2 type transport system permease protein